MLRQGAVAVKRYAVSGKQYVDVLGQLCKGAQYAGLVLLLGEACHLQQHEVVLAHAFHHVGALLAKYVAAVHLGQCHAVLNHAQRHAAGHAFLHKVLCPFRYADYAVVHPVHALVDERGKPVSATGVERGVLRGDERAALLAVELMRKSRPVLGGEEVRMYHVGLADHLAQLRHGQRTISSARQVERYYIDAALAQGNLEVAAALQ